MGKIRLCVPFILLLWFKFSIENVECDTEILVNTNGGIVRGSSLNTRDNANVLAFYSIRYAEPPVRQNRFKPPIPVRPWEGAYDATQQGVACHQPNANPSYILSEDCLHLDVYTKNLSSSQPVIVFIHGGGNLFGAKSDISPIYLLEQDVVLVSINYRLHALGFFSAGTAEAPGNNGFKDQVLALKWVRDNIRAFGGNPQLVTLNGHSAGGMSVSLHIVSPMSRGLFQQAIVMSGTAMSHQTSKTRENSKKLLERTNCQSENVTKSLDCLSSLPIESISKHVTINNGCTMTMWNYDIEPLSSHGERFLVEDPTTSLLEGKFPSIPIVVGITIGEFGYYAHVLIENQALLKILNKDFSSHAPFCLLYDENENKDSISARLRTFYLKNQVLTNDSLQQVEDLWADGTIGFGVYRFMSLASLHTEVFYYRFDYAGRYSHFYKPDGQPLGAVHGDELQYLYVFEKIAPVIPKEAPENVIIKRMTRWWAQFAKTGNPNNPDDEQIQDIRWLPTTQNNYRALYINFTSQMGETPYLERYSLWDSMFPLSDDDKKSILIETVSRNKDEM